MKRILIFNIKELVAIDDSNRSFVAGKEMSTLTTLKNAWLLIEGDRIKDYGIGMPDSGSRMPDKNDLISGIRHQVSDYNLTIIDATGKMVFPSFCDSHTHLVYAGSREIEYGDKIKGLSYEEIAKRGGGILNSAKLLHETSEEEMVEQAMGRLNEIIRLGTGAVEIKSGYGLT
nr:imidazolonepropionase [Bacteroidota bacterium]